VNSCKGLSGTAHLKGRAGGSSAAWSERQQMVGGVSPHEQRGVDSFLYSRG
jgi:hypothetical protein